MNRHIMVDYLMEKQHLIIVRQLKSQSMTMWPTVSYNHGLTFVTMNSERYVEIEVARLIRRDAFYQQDGAPHLTL